MPTTSDDDKPPYIPDEQDGLDRLAAMPDADIDTTDIPETLDWRGAIRGIAPTRRMRRAAMLDNDAVEWFERRHVDLAGCAAEINRTLQSHIAQQAKPAE